MGLRRDRDQRPELSKGVVEFIAPAEYMVRPPQEPTYFFVIDVSATAVRSGMLQSAAAAIKRSLDDLPGRNRTKIGFITYDNSVHYYNMAPGLSTPQMMVVSDLKELFVPLPDHLLVNLKESRGVVEAFLDSLPEMFSKNPVPGLSCMGPALKAAFTVMKQIGGKMCVFQSILPNLGDGALRPRENQGVMGTPNEVKLLRPEVSWYKDTAIEFSRQQISVDMFLFPYQYMDVAALSDLPRYSAGSLYSYVGFSQAKDGAKFETELHKALTQNTAFEAVMRIRCTKGMRITNFYGNFFIRGTDLLALPNCNTDSVYGFDLVHDEQNMAGNVVTVQAALLYTSSDGERRIRVMTQALPVTNLTSELVSSVDTEAMCCLLSKQALDASMKNSLDSARMRMQQTCIDIIRSAKGGDKRTVSGYTVPPPSAPGAPDAGDDKAIPDNLELLPLYTLAMMKNVAFRGGTDVHPDERVQAHYSMNCMWVKGFRDFIYPKMFSIHDMGADVGLAMDNEPDDPALQVAGRDRILLPQAVNLSVDRLTSDGVFMVDNGVDINIWVGRSVDPAIINALFGVPSLENVDMNQVSRRTGAGVLCFRQLTQLPSFTRSRCNLATILAHVSVALCLLFVRILRILSLLVPRSTLLERGMLTWKPDFSGSSLKIVHHSREEHTVTENSWTLLARAVVVRHLLVQEWVLEAHLLHLQEDAARHHQGITDPDHLREGHPRHRVEWGVHRHRQDHQDRVDLLLHQWVEWELHHLDEWVPRHHHQLEHDHSVLPRQVGRPQAECHHHQDEQVLQHPKLLLQLMAHQRLHTVHHRLGRRLPALHLVRMVRLHHRSRRAGLVPHHPLLSKGMGHLHHKQGETELRLHRHDLLLIPRHRLPPLVPTACLHHQEWETHLLLPLLQAIIDKPLLADLREMLTLRNKTFKLITRNKTCLESARKQLVSSVYCHLVAEIAAEQLHCKQKPNP